MTLKKYIHSQDAGYKLLPKKSGETSLNLSADIYELIKPKDLIKGEGHPVTFVLFKEDFIKAIAFIVNSLPLFTSSSRASNRIDFSVSLFNKMLKTINDFFGDKEEMPYEVNLYYREDGRYYLNSLKVAEFTLRDFLVQDRSILIFSNDDNRNTLRLKMGMFDQSNEEQNDINHFIPIEYLPYVTAIRTKPLVLLAGISGTGKSRIVRELARACWPIDALERKAQKPENYEIIQVKPNWHDSSELIGYVSRISGKPQYVPGKFVEFMAKAWAHPETPYFLCLDEMNLAPVEQYFAEYLSVIETRKLTDERIVTDALISKSDDEWYGDLVRAISPTEDVQKIFLTEGITIPQNLIVMGTVNMDETTFTFSRKVLDRAMTIEMNEVNLAGGLDRSKEKQLVLESNQLIGDAAEGYDVYPYNKEVCDKVIAYLEDINENLDKTPFKIAYRARNEFLIYAVNRLKVSLDGNRDSILAKAMDEMTSMKILSRIEGDEQRIQLSLFDNLREVIKKHLNYDDDASMEESPSLSKINEMEKKLKETGFTSFWS